MTTEKKIEQLIDGDMALVKRGYLEGDSSFLYSIITQVGWTPYKDMSSQQISEEHKSRYPEVLNGHAFAPHHADYS